MKWVWVIMLLCIPLVSADGFYDSWQNCTNDGFDYCQTYAFTYVYNNCPGDSFSNLSLNNYDSARIQSKVKNGYYIGPVVVEYACSDHATITIDNSFVDIDPVPGWPDCNQYGCFGSSISRSGNITIAYPPYDHIPDYKIQCWTAWTTTCTYQDNSTQVVDTWSWQGYGYYNFTWKVVGCYDNSDCSSDQICDNSGEWYNWTCVSNQSNVQQINRTIEDHYSVPVVVYSVGHKYNASYNTNDLPVIAGDAVATFLSTIASMAEILVFTGLVVSGVYLYRNHFD